jgi:hypothetical protein
MFRRVRLSIIRSLFTVNSAMVYVIRVVDSFRAGPDILVQLERCLQTCITYTIYLFCHETLFCRENLHVSDNSSVHQQEFIHSTLNNGICHTGL